MGDGTTFYWFIDGESIGVGYAQKWALPLPGDRVLMQPRLNWQPGESEPEPDYLVEVTHRTLSAPEQDSPWIQVHAKRVVPTPIRTVDEDVRLLEDVIGSVYLHGDYRWLTKQMTTEQKERFADAVDAWASRLNMDDPGPPLERWWRE